MTPIEAISGAIAAAAGPQEIVQALAAAGYQITAVPVPSPEDAQHAAEIETGSALPGFDGVLWRLIARCDYRAIEKWQLGERIRSTPPEHLFDAMVVWINSAVVMTAGQVGRQQMRSAAQRILRMVAVAVESDIVEIIAAKKAGAIVRNKLRLILPEGN